MSHTQQHEAQNKQPELPFETAPVKSWGDKLKGKISSMFAHIGVNYFVNATISVAIAVLFNRKWGERIDNALDTHTSKWAQKDFFKKGIFENIDAQKYLKGVIDYVSRSQLLLMGGHILVPLMKGMAENKMRVQFFFGQVLDRTQELFGFGNEASRRNLHEYEQIKQAQKLGYVPAEGPLTKEVLQKHGVDEDLKFKRKKLPWGNFIKARLFGMLASLVTNTTLKTSETKEWPVNYGQFERGVAPRLQRFFDKVPGFMKAFPKEKDRETWAKYYTNDLILTASSFLAFKTVGDFLVKKAEKKEAALNGDSNDLHGNKAAHEEHSARHHDRRHHEGGHRQRVEKDRAAREAASQVPGAAL